MLKIGISLEDAWGVLQADRQLFELATTLSVDSAGGLLDERCDQGVDHAVPGALWARLRLELYKIVCSEERPFKKLRGAGVVSVTSLSSILASRLGIDQTAVPPFVALAVVAGSFGTADWCKEQNRAIAQSNQPLPDPPKPEARQPPQKSDPGSS